MVDNIVSKPLWLVLIFTAQMVFNGSSRAEVTRNLGDNVSFEFTFNISVTERELQTFSVYTTNDTKIAGYTQGRGSSKDDHFDIYPLNTSVFVHIINLKRNHSGVYWVTLFMDSNYIKSNEVQLIVREENRNSTVLPVTNDNTNNEESGSPIYFSSHIVTVLVVLPVVLLAALLPLLIWCLVRTNDEQQPPQEVSTPTIQETVEAFNNVSAPSLVYSVLDFPKRPQTVLEINPNDTEYAAVSYLPEKSVTCR